MMIPYFDVTWLELFYVFVICLPFAIMLSVALRDLLEVLDRKKTENDLRL